MALNLSCKADVVTEATIKNNLEEPIQFHNGETLQSELFKLRVLVTITLVKIKVRQESRDKAG